MSVKRMWLFNCGWLAMDESLAMYLGRFGQKRRIPVSAALVDTDDGYVLFDTGLNPAALEDPVGRRARREGRHSRRVRCRPRHPGPASAGRACAEGRALGSQQPPALGSHRRKRPLPAATMILQEAEFRFAHAPDPFVRSVYLAQQYDLERDYQLINGEHVLCPGVGIIDTRSHSPGHQSLIVNLPHTGRVICSGDSLYYQEDLAQPWPPAIRGRCRTPIGRPASCRSCRTTSGLRYSSAMILRSGAGRMNGCDY
jgi:N-acyl homoserine lactone hydrolase